MKKGIQVTRFMFNIMNPQKENRQHAQLIRWRSDKYLTLPPEGATIARQLLSKFQSNRTRSFVLTAYGNVRVRGFYKNGKRAISVGDSILVFEREIAQRNQRALGCCVR